MAEYRITIRKSVVRELEDIPQRDLERVINRIRSLAKEPRPHGSQKLSGKEQYRVRQGDYRIVYSIEDKDSSVNVVKVGHRREIYRS